VFIHAKAVLGSNCTLRQGVTIGNREEDGGAPVIGDNVEFGAYAQVLGNVSIGNSCKIGAMAVVLDDVPAGATAVGQPARIVTRHAMPIPLRDPARSAGAGA
jgi:serine O-acetyltransferase